MRVSTFKFWGHGSWGLGVSCCPKRISFSLCMLLKLRVKYWDHGSKWPKWVSSIGWLGSPVERGAGEDLSRSRAATSSRWKEAVDVVQVYDQDASWVPSFGGFPDTGVDPEHIGEIINLIWLRDSTGPPTPPKELENVTGERDVWTSLLSVTVPWLAVKTVKSWKRVGVFAGDTLVWS